jgi:drug/metabolite transporter (DMT)-like permease
MNSPPSSTPDLPAKHGRLPDPEIEPRDDATARSDVLKGMLFMIGAMILIPILDAITKLLSTQYGVSPGQVTFSRFFVQAILLCTVLLMFKPAPNLLPQQWGGNLFRGGFHALASLSFFIALRYMPLADANAIFFVEPLMLVLASAWILKENVGWRRQSSVMVGFVGAVIVIRPNFIELGWTSLFPLLAASLFTCYMLLTKKLAGRDHPLSMQLAAGIGGSTVIAVALIIGYFTQWGELTLSLPENNVAWLLLFLVGAIAAVGHLFITIALRYCAASLLAPFQYLEIVVATGFGFFLFGNFPDLYKWIGIAIIISSGLFVFWRERLLAKA